MSTPDAIAAALSDTCVDKAGLPIGRMTGLGVLAGAYIGFGSLAAVLLGAGADGLPVGIAQAAAGVGFSLGLILVLLAGAELFTGNTLMTAPLAQRRIGLGALARAWSVVWVANLVGAVLLVLLAIGAGVHTGDDGAVAASAIELAADKAGKPAAAIVASGILANVLVCLAVWMAAGAQSAVDKVAVIVPPIAAFVALGLEHSIANMSLLPLGLLAQAATGAELPGALSWSSAGANLVWATLGNIIGGGGLGLAYWAIHLRKK
ncbi:formate/nitrite transporter family protein [Luteimonas deserti]|uniref:Formate/nitrite transporter family protein n=1 Tax=Luteimonas deserti TaxID=2752306 RepID=A0A7Z0QSN5_9GAMM|nr:formate/nitrite transporter family protein [Luteimonas deserti]NYZ63045.1 formate/nitrite transporter family protein [Luteimonas deserti]